MTLLEAFNKTLTHGREMGSGRGGAWCDGLTRTGGSGPGGGKAWLVPDSPLAAGDPHIGREGEREREREKVAWWRGRPTAYV